eukprot:TRINITY_DN24202_c0_g1_i1.p1 TRINITY_DN24202_c0_g1~~TRINITY_DN24202_c0_g1_i1.p1  ORF type:complete len:442 (-),score=62.40 TRINITY_DN24202_c0_g1_i1:147-1436(-)
MAGLEMRGVVDEPDDAGRRAPPENRNNTWNWDKICAYYTNKIVRIQDANLGYLYWGIVSLILIYIQVVVFHLEGRHSMQEPGIGAVITKFKAKGFGTDGKAFDASDLRHPIIEPSGAFITTRRITVKGQRLGECIDWDTADPCPCGKGGTCDATQNLCQVRGWCPSIGDRNAANPPAGAVIENITGLSEAVLMITAGIGFPSLGAKFHVAGSMEGSSQLHKHITVQEVLDLADPPLKLADVSEKGCIIAVNFFWNCDLSWVNECEPLLSVKRVDDGTGFVQKRAKKRRENGVDLRDATYMYGLRFVVDSSGIGRQISLVPIVIQIGSCLALVQIASKAADFLMLNMYDKERSSAYYRLKVKETQDYADLQERINLIQEQKANARSDISAGVVRSSGAGAGVAFGLGAGGRGAMSSVLRGRNTGARSSSG